jgi:diguanylate cyclase (GGDEF)-like protein
VIAPRSDGGPRESVVHRNPGEARPDGTRTEFDEGPSMSRTPAIPFDFNPEAADRGRAASVARLRRLRSYRPGRSALLVIGIWLLGLLTLGGVFLFEGRADATRRAQVVIAQMRNEQSSLLAVAFSPAIAPSAPRPAETARQLAGAKSVYLDSLDRLAALGRSDEPARIETTSARYFAFIDHLSTLVARGATTQAALQLGASERPGGIQFVLAAEFDRADVGYGNDAEASREVASTATAAATILLLVAFSIAFHHLLRARRRSHEDATTDALTGLGNRRKLFSDMAQPAGAPERPSTLVAIFDLDGFKAYNDTFGHPAGDALLAGLGRNLAGAVAERGQAYRIGGDEFVVTTSDDAGEQLLLAARSALSEQGPGFSVGCSIGSTRLQGGSSLEDALHVADQLLYTNKRSSRDEVEPDAKDALLQVLAEQNAELVTHLGQVSELAARTAERLGLPAAQVRLTRLAAELHDIGKSAMPASILDKPGPLDAAERWFMQRHSEIGERIVAAAPTLRATAPVVRAAHERPDGKGYPDGLTLEQIPVSSRIIAVVDAYDAMTSDRAYQQAMQPADALAELRRHAGTQFDAAVVEAFASTMSISARDTIAA